MTNNIYSFHNLLLIQNNHPYLNKKGDWINYLFFMIQFFNCLNDREVELCNKNQLDT